MKESKITEYIKEYNSSEWKKSMYEEIYQLISLEISQIEIDAKLKHSDDLHLQYLVKSMKLESLFRDFVFDMILFRISENNKKESIIKLLNSK